MEGRVKARERKMVRETRTLWIKSLGNEIIYYQKNLLDGAFVIRYNLSEKR